MPALSNVDHNTDNIVQDLSKRLPPENEANPNNGNNNNNNISNNNNQNHNNNNNNNNNTSPDGNMEFKRMEYGPYKMESLGNFPAESFSNADELPAPTDLTQSGEISFKINFIQGGVGTKRCRVPSVRNF